MSDKKDQQRIIGRWTIGPTLGKGSYSWVKRGQDIKTGKIVALKFIEKTNVSWVKEQAKQVETEIEALKHICHQNVMKLYAYNLNAQYPLASGTAADDDTHSSHKQAKGDQQYIDTILLVSEYAPGGELFDIFYYTSALKEIVARTYFKQMINGLEACHNCNVLHRDLRPQNLLLDAKCNLKITDFGLSKIIQSDADAVGSRRYQAPELLWKQKYDLKCDLFSAGVILFILLAGYPPFEQAVKSDKWFKPLLKGGNVEKFWKAHQKSPIAQIPEAKDLLTRMLCFQPKQRIDMYGIKNHPWMKREVLKQKDLIAQVRDRHRKAEKKRRQDVRKMNDLAQELNPNKSPGIGVQAKLKLFPKGYIECMFGEAYTYLERMQELDNLYDLFEEAIGGKGQGKAEFDFKKGILNCEMSVSRPVQDEQKARQDEVDAVKFDIEIFESRVWKDRYQELEEAVSIKENNTYQIFVIRITRTEGDAWMFSKLKNGFLLTHCSSIIKGLPDWARKIEKQEAKQGNNYDDDAKEVELVDEYSKELGDIFKDENKGGIQVAVET